VERRHDPLPLHHGRLLGALIPSTYLDPRDELLRSWGIVLLLATFLFLESYSSGLPVQDLSLSGLT
jgi:hypothetical protein